jgi:hypothetical protein
MESEEHRRGQEKECSEDNEFEATSNEGRAASKETVSPEAHGSREERDGDYSAEVGLDPSSKRHAGAKNWHDVRPLASD